MEHFSSAAQSGICNAPEHNIKFTCVISCSRGETVYAIYAAGSRHNGKGRGGMMKRLGAAAVILDSEGRVLLVRHTYGRLNWELPGGHAEPGESIITTATREVYEETGLAVEAEGTSGIYFDDQLDLHFFVFRCRQLDAYAIPAVKNSEIAACAFWSPTALPRPMSDLTIRRIHDALSGVGSLLPVIARPRPKCCVS